MKQIIIPIDNVFHGTYSKYLDNIMSSGINKMSRKHIHISNGINAISGKRKDCNVLIYINMGKAMNDGMLFYESENEVILTEGFNGIIDPKYFLQVVNI